jgi:hypothetical protein
MNNPLSIHIDFRLPGQLETTMGKDSSKTDLKKCLTTVMCYLSFYPLNLKIVQ